MHLVEGHGEDVGVGEVLQGVAGEQEALQVRQAREGPGGERADAALGEIKLD